MKFYINGQWYDGKETPVLILGDSPNDFEVIKTKISIVKDDYGNEYFAIMCDNSIGANLLDFWNDALIKANKIRLF